MLLEWEYFMMKNWHHACRLLLFINYTRKQGRFIRGQEGCDDHYACLFVYSDYSVSVSSLVDLSAELVVLLKSRSCSMALNTKFSICSRFGTDTHSEQMHLSTFNRSEYYATFFSSFSNPIHANTIWYFFMGDFFSIGKTC